MSVRIALQARGVPAATAPTLEAGVPMARGLARDAAMLSVTTAEGRPVPHQLATLARWSDGSIKWLKVIARPPADARPDALLLTDGAADAAPAAALVVEESPGAVVVASDLLRVRCRTGADTRIEVLRADGTPLLEAEGLQLVLTDARGARCDAVAAQIHVEARGPLRATLRLEGQFRRAGQALPLEFVLRLGIEWNNPVVSAELRLRNPNAARHTGGLWDLGDPESVLFRDVSLRLRPRQPATTLHWRPDPAGAEQPCDAAPWVLYQDSSGGENWDSDNHLDRTGARSVAWRGYRVWRGTGEGQQILAQGERATPIARLVHPEGWIAAAVQDFWQNFPKALRCTDGALSVGLFPAESRGCHELQPGEQKRHLVWLEFGRGDAPSTLPGLMGGALLQCSPEHIESTGAVPYFVGTLPADSQRALDYVSQIVSGDNSFFARREQIDEYGWRNYGDLYADHEAIHHRGDRPMVSHYNNQYDFVFGAFVHYLRTGDPRWHGLLSAAARHHVDIDIYHTTGDKAAFNGGLFWHTDHYAPAATSTHRTYSGRNGGKGYGGGPSNEHNYSTGLLHYHFLSGDPDAAEAVRGLADWVLAQDDGAQDLLGLVDAGPTGRASQTVSVDYHRPGRGAGNSINALLDAHALTKSRRYMAKAEELLQRCIHPADDVAALDLSQPEYRWSYLVFLQVLARYLDVKSEMGEEDYHFHYARESLMAYAGWMAEHERPYKEWLDRVLLPTETWSAHDVRKSHVLHAAAKYAPAARRQALHERAAFFFHRCIEDLLSFPTAGLTRPLVILSVYGHVHGYFQQKAGQFADRSWLHDHDFGTPVAFRTQRQRLVGTLRARLQVAAREVGRLVRERLLLLKRRVSR